MFAFIKLYTYKTNLLFIGNKTSFKKTSKRLENLSGNIIKYLLRNLQLLKNTLLFALQIRDFMTVVCYANYIFFTAYRNVR